MDSALVKFIAESLKILKEHDEKAESIENKYGIWLLEYDSNIILKLRDSVVYLISGFYDHENYCKILDDINWWLYEDVEKVITLTDMDKPVKVNVEDPTAFVSLICDLYGIKQ